MLKVRAPMRAKVPQYPRAANRGIGQIIRKAGGSSLTLLVMLFWLIVYQNLPENPLNDVSAAGRASMVNADAGAGAGAGAAAATDTGNTLFRVIRIGMI